MTPDLDSLRNGLSVSIGALGAFVPWPRGPVRRGPAEGLWASEFFPGYPSGPGD